MPLYEFECNDCERAFEELVRATTAATAVKCPRCGGSHVHRKISTFAARISAGSSAATAAACAPGGG